MVVAGAPKLPCYWGSRANRNVGCMTLRCNQVKVDGQGIVLEGGVDALAIMGSNVLPTNANDKDNIDLILLI